MNLLEEEYRQTSRRQVDMAGPKKGTPAVSDRRWATTPQCLTTHGIYPVIVRSQHFGEISRSCLLSLVFRIHQQSCDSLRRMQSRQQALAPKRAGKEKSGLARAMLRWFRHERAERAMLCYNKGNVLSMGNVLSYGKCAIIGLSFYKPYCDVHVLNMTILQLCSRST